jgi:transcriptional repressor NrdR
MRCPFCGKSGSRVLEKRETDDGGANRRRRECLRCRKRWTTYEKAEMPALWVVKKDGRRESFDLGKLKAGMFKACEKRPVSAAKIGAAAGEILAELRDEEDLKEIPSRLIGEKVMAKLRKIDAVAYIRFASVYREFADVSAFGRELERLHSKIKRKAST